ncbi:MAG: 2OG-Fe(II) oxygenase [Flavobacteriales bacterium]|nr:2OG-Fe(II) oxygenase [Flavobacteriales bacterium]
MDTYPFAIATLPNFVEYLCSEGAFLPHEIQRINELWQAEKSDEAELEGGVSQDDTLRKSSIIPIYTNNVNKWIFDKMAQYIGESNQYYNFDLNGIYEPLQLAEYGIGDFFDWHLDFGSGESSTRKLSLTIQLSDPSEYEGGDLEFQINNKTVKAPRAQGTVIIFPSFIMHRVTEITKGNRRSIVGWVSGPPYR